MTKQRWNFLRYVEPDAILTAIIINKKIKCRVSANRNFKKIITSLDIRKLTNVSNTKLLKMSHRTSDFTNEMNNENNKTKHNTATYINRILCTNINVLVLIWNDTLHILMPIPNQNKHIDICASNSVNVCSMFVLFTAIVHVSSYNCDRSYKCTAECLRLISLTSISIECVINLRRYSFQNRS